MKEERTNQAIYKGANLKLEDIKTIEETLKNSPETEDSFEC